MQEWMKLPVSQLKKLVKSRAGRIAELQMEVKILEGIMEKKVQEGDLGGSAPRQPAGGQENPGRAAREPAKHKASPEAAMPEEPEPSGTEEPGQTKITQASSNHAFKEID